MGVFIRLQSLCLLLYVFHNAVNSMAESGITKSAIYQVCLLLEKVHFQVLLAVVKAEQSFEVVEGIFKMSAAATVL